MSNLNFKHLRYFWMVAKTGSIARAAEQLHLTPQSISGQLSDFADTLGVELFRRSGRQLELTDTGRRILSHAEDIFSAGDELLEIVRDQSRATTTAFRVGCADSVSKLIACRLVEPALGLEEPLRIICREGRLASLLADLAVHRLDLIIADRPMPAHLSVRGYNHLLGESGMTLLGTAALAASLQGDFPQCLDRAPLLLPGEDYAIYGRLLQWLSEHNLHPRIVGEFDDSAMMKAFGQSGAGLFFAPTVIARQVCQQYAVVELGRVDSLVEQVYAITTERRLRHPATVAISQSARRDLFV
ncbi:MULTISPECIES: transcriptional activator NhaR [unclassified Janthinobacterium]|uniref:transcriptional activator NhaR n=1 Tax=unclassified Janthinobacterium TaxID=2610881 RepID=UPI00089187CF|nr:MULTISPECIES: transcriptional activator NhaR [unclassified Janthinobacterium]SDA76390.1 LysR family transcriptional regulator, transcriptional activator of nhaA [Janthinobacterium sp. 551a]SFB61071.1 LysR family transcriptional regulator, transcriptional activator of nhaA [Janthinobacterium sp. 344]